jgi:ATP-binding cassette subfamily B protein
MALVPLARFAADAFGHLTLGALDRIVFGLVGLYVLKGLFTFGQVALAQRVALLVAARLREDVFAHLLELDLRALAGHRAADLSSRLVQDLGVVKDALASVLAEVVPSIAIVTYSLGYAWWLNWRLALATMLGAPLVGLAIAAFGRRLHAQSGLIQARVSDVFVRANETLAALSVVRAFGRGPDELGRFAATNSRHQEAHWQGALIQAWQPAVITLLQISAIGVVLWVGGYEITRGRLSGPDLFGFAAAIGVGVDPTLALSQAWGRIQSASGALARVFELLTAPRRAQPLSPAPLGTMIGLIEVKNLVFGYQPGRPVLRNVDLRIAPGEVVALAGPSGGGKSTLAALVLGLYDPDEGLITLDGRDIRTIADHDLRRAIAYVPQDATLFAGSVAQNVAFGRPAATRHEIQTVCQAANAHDFILELPQGYDTEVGERGEALSGGQRQRIAIARAMLVDPRVLVLDEATAALDNETAGLVQTALARLMNGRTTLVIAHRLEAIARADRIYVLEEGRVSESGSPQALLATSSSFKRLTDAATLSSDLLGN